MNEEQALKYIHELLKLMVGKNASDLFLSADFPPSMKVDGKMTPVANLRLTGEHTRVFAHAIMSERQRAEFEKELECNFAISPDGIGRFRVNVFVQLGQVGMVLRTINTKIPTMEALKLPAVMKEIIMVKRGLVILVGGTGSGKSTTLAALIDYRNEKSHGHIITIEDPVEYVHKSKNCLVTHREIGKDTHDWFPALKNTLRQAPDVILIGEIRDRDTMEFALAFAETGHLCMATLHANNANQALDRIVNFFPEERRQQLLMDLSLNMKAFISQRLIPGINGGRVAAIEIMMNSPLISELILKGETHAIKEIMTKSRELGMQTFDQHLFDLYNSGTITQEEALRNADAINELRLKMKLHGAHSSGHAAMSNLDHLSLHKKPEEEEEEEQEDAQN
jgi:twitching motility protein PilU